MLGVASGGDADVVRVWPGDAPDPEVRAAEQEPVLPAVDAHNGHGRVIERGDALGVGRPREGHERVPELRRVYLQKRAVVAAVSTHDAKRGRAEIGEQVAARRPRERSAVALQGAGHGCHVACPKIELSE
jgi:hypothetical protein